MRHNANELASAPDALLRHRRASIIELLVTVHSAVGWAGQRQRLSTAAQRARTELYVTNLLY
jgi:hypothetical protein